MNSCVIGWCDTYNNNLQTVPFTKERKKALVERMRKRKYNFTFASYEYLPYCCPVYEDNTTCILTKQQFEEVMNETWKDMRIGPRLMPMDAINIPAKNGILYEKEKFVEKEKRQNA